MVQAPCALVVETELVLNHTSGTVFRCYITSRTATTVGTTTSAYKTLQQVYGAPDGKCMGDQGHYDS